jgi:hypothetical protein
VTCGGVVIRFLTCVYAGFDSFLWDRIAVEATLKRNANQN